LTSALDGGQWSASRLGRFTPGERTPVTHWTGDWADLDAVEKKKKFYHCLRRKLNPTCSWCGA